MAAVCFVNMFVFRIGKIKVTSFQCCKGNLGLKTLHNMCILFAAADDKSTGLECNEKVKNLVKDSKGLTVSPTTLQKSLGILNKVGIDPKYLSSYPQLLDIRPDVLTNHTKLMRDLQLDDDAVVEMLSSHPALLWKCYKTCNNDMKRFSHHRIQYLCEELEISQQEFCSKLLKYKFILSLSFQRIKDVVQVLLDRKVEPADILSDFWILRCKAQTIATRLDRVKDAEVETIRPWMGRCKRKIFEGFINRASTKQELLGDLSLEEYISQRLSCSVSEIKEVIDREPQVQKTSVLKMKRILDFLISSGFSPSHILAGLPRVANRRIETINARLFEMNQIGLTPSLYVVCKSQKDFQYYINKRKTREMNS